MSQENVDRALELLDAFNRRDLDAFVAMADDRIEVESRLVAMEGGYHGHHDSVQVSVMPDPEDAGPAEKPAQVPSSSGIPAAIRST